MTEPFIFIGSYWVKPGHLEEASHRMREINELVEQREPRLRSFHLYLDWLELGSSTQLVLGTPPQVVIDYAREYDEGLDSYPTFVAGFTRDIREGVLR